MVKCTAIVASTTFCTESLRVSTDAYVNTYVHTHIHLCMHTDRWTDGPTGRQTDRHSCANTYRYAYIHAYAGTFIHVHILTAIDIHTHMCLCICTYARRLCRKAQSLRTKRTIKVGHTIRYMDDKPFERPFNPQGMLLDPACFARRPGSSATSMVTSTALSSG